MLFLWNTPQMLNIVISWELSSSDIFLFRPLKIIYPQNILSCFWRQPFRNMEVSRHTICWNTWGFQRHILQQCTDSANCDFSAPRGPQHYMLSNFDGLASRFHLFIPGSSPTFLELMASDGGSESPIILADARCLIQTEG